MSDANLLAFGCAVTFIAVAGVYVYLRECWEADEPPRRPEAKPEEAVPANLRDVA
jgi:hypothetical protein